MPKFAKGIGGFVGHLLDVVVRIIPMFRTDSHLPAPALTNVAIDEVIGSVEKFLCHPVPHMRPLFLNLLEILRCKNILFVF
jgi:hypothetical protein